MTLRAADLELPLRTADPALAAIMERHAASLPRIQPRPTGWPDRVQQALADAALAEDPLSLTSVARRLATSPRTLQRRLAEAGSTWRRELDRARQAQFARLHRHPGAPSDGKAGLLGYSDARALRRARRRWAAR
jgi:AraC-like DNA-binding protein